MTRRRGLRPQVQRVASPPAGTKAWLTRPSRRARAHDQPPDSEGRRDGRESIPSLTPSQDRRRLQKAPAPHSFLRDRTATAASLRRARFPEGSRSVRHVLSLLFNGKSGLHINGKCGMKTPKSTHSTENDTVVGGTVFMVFALNCGPCSLFRPTSPLQPAIPQRLPRAATR